MIKNEHYSQKNIKCFVSCYDYSDKPYVRKLTHYEVPEAVYNYILQLEAEINYQTGNIKKLYEFRFNQEPKSIKTLTQEIMKVN